MVTRQTEVLDSDQVPWKKHFTLEYGAKNLNDRLGKNNWTLKNPCLKCSTEFVISPINHFISGLFLLFAS